MLRKTTLMLTLTLLFGTALFAQDAQEVSPTAALTSALVAACRQNEELFAKYLTKQNARTFGDLPQDQRKRLLERLVLLGEPGKPLLSDDMKGHTSIRCSSSAATVVLQLGDPREEENLAFISVEAHADSPRAAGGGPRQVEFGLVREGGGWRLLSVGLLVLDLRQLSREWADQDLEAKEERAMAVLRRLADSIGSYQRAFGRLPESLEQLGPSKGGVSPEASNHIDAELASGKAGGYRFRYRIVPPGDRTTGDATEVEFELGAAPTEYGVTGRRSFFLDSNGVMRGGDHKGGPATSEDPHIPSR